MQSLAVQIDANRGDRKTLIALRNMLAFNLSHLIRNAAMLPVRDQRMIVMGLHDSRHVSEAIRSTRRRARFLAIAFRASPLLTCACCRAYTLMFGARPARQPAHQ